MLPQSYYFAKSFEVIYMGMLPQSFFYKSIEVNVTSKLLFCKIV